MSIINGVLVPFRIIKKIPLFCPLPSKSIKLCFDSKSISSVLSWVDSDFIYETLCLDKHVMKLIYHLSLEEQFGQCITQAMNSFNISVRDLLLVQERVSLPCSDYYYHYHRMTGTEIPGISYKCREDTEEHDEMFCMEEL